MSDNRPYVKRKGAQPPAPSANPGGLNEWTLAGNFRRLRQAAES